MPAVQEKSHYWAISVSKIVLVNHGNCDNDDFGEFLVIYFQSSEDLLGEGLLDLFLWGCLSIQFL